MMNFPKNRTEIMDHVAITAMNKNLADAEKEPLIRLALMHWNHVEDKTLPETVYEGFDLNWTSPVNQLELQGLILGAPDYIEERKEAIFEELGNIQSEMLDLVNRQRDLSGNVEVNHYDIARRQNVLQDRMVEVSGTLKAMGDQIIDRVIEIDIDTYLDSKSAKRLMEDMKEALVLDEKFSLGVDYRVESKRNEDTLKIYTPNEHVNEILEGLAAVTPEDTFLNIRVESYHNALPSYKDTADVLHRETVKRQFEKEKEKKKEIDFSIMGM